jgi:hypothetical protein
MDLDETLQEMIFERCHEQGMELPMSDTTTTLSLGQAARLAGLGKTRSAVRS